MRYRRHGRARMEPHSIMNGLKNARSLSDINLCTEAVPRRRLAPAKPGAPRWQENLKDVFYSEKCE
jgi:hypothetical protein